jgi:DNA-binding GntR family transcriptional regulator
MSVMSADLAYDTLRAMIYRRQLEPGERLVERDLAAQLGISRIPLREGLARLESEGLVRSVRNTGSFVEDFAPVDVLEIYSIRLLLEPTATKLATIRSGSRLSKQLQQLCAQMTAYQAKQNYRKVDELDYQFHLSIVHASGHRRLIRAYESCHIQILASHLEEETLQLLPFDSTAAEHARIVESIAAGRPVAAEQAASEHVRNAMRMKESHLGMQFENVTTS